MADISTAQSSDTRAGKGSRGDSGGPTARGAQRALDILAVFARERRPLSISELARTLRIPTSTCHGLVKTLEQVGYLIEIKRARGYYPTSLLLRLATEIARFDPIPALLGPHLAALRDETGETVVLGKRARNKAVYIDVLECTEGLHYVAKVGDMRPLHATAIGKALLSTMAAADRERIVEQLNYEKLTVTTLTTPAQLLDSIEEGRRRGWYWCDGEYYLDICALAVPVDVRGDQYCIVVSGPRERIHRNLDRHGEILKKLKKTIEAANF